MDWALAGLVVALSSLLGTIPFGLLIGKRLGVDVRTQGSGNIGATNVARTVGKKVGVLVLLLDALKGALPLLCYRLLELDGAIALPPAVDGYLFTAVGAAPMLGHCFPVWLRFRGGKGVATALGAFLVADPLLVLLAAGVFAALYLATRVVSLGSISAAASAPLLAVLLDRPAPIVALALIGAILIIGKHHQNIRRLLRRTELKL